MRHGVIPAQSGTVHGEARGIGGSIPMQGWVQDMGQKIELPRDESINVKNQVCRSGSLAIFGRGGDMIHTP